MSIRKLSRNIFHGQLSSHSLHRQIFFGIGAVLEIKNPIAVRPPPPNAVFEELFKKNNRLTAAQIENLAKKHEVKPQTVSRWWKRRRAQNQEKTLTKFSESAWKASYSIAITAFGLWNVWNEPYMWNFDKSMENWPNHVRHCIEK